MAINKASGAASSASRGVSGSGLEGLGATSWGPNMDVYTTDDTLVVNIEVAGMSREDLEVTIDQGRIRILGQRADSTRQTRCRFLVMEINYGSFERTIEVPPGYDVNRAQASYQNGFLRILVPSARPGEAKTLPIG